MASTWEGKPPWVIEDSRLIYALCQLPADFTKADAAECWRRKDLDPHILEAIWSALIAAELLLVLDGEGDATGAWSRHSWDEACLYHAGTRDFPFVQMNEVGAGAKDEQRMVDFAAQAAPPSVYLKVDAQHSIPLRKITTQTAFSEQLKPLSREQRRSIEGLGFLLDICFGERGKIDFGVQGEFLLKAVPSGGARHPTEAFLSIFSLPGVTPGIYHYNVETHALDLYQAGDYYNHLQNATFDLFKKYVDRPFALLLFTCLHERAMWRYRDSRSWRATLADIGHAMMAFRSVTERLDIRTYTYQKFRDGMLSEILPFDLYRLTPYYVSTLV